MIEGVRYRVVYQVPGVHRKPRVMIGVYLGPGGGGLEFSLRPEAGTTAIQRAHIISASQTLGKIHTPRMA